MTLLSHYLIKKRPEQPPKTVTGNLPLRTAAKSSLAVSWDVEAASADNPATVDNNQALRPVVETSDMTPIHGADIATESDDTT